MLAADHKTPGQKHLLLNCPGVNFIDMAGAHMLAQEAERRARLGGSLVLCGLKDGPMSSLSDSHLGGAFSANDLLPMGAPDPVGHSFQRLDPNVCATCTRRIFKQCASAPKPAGWQPSEEDNADGRRL